MAKISQETLAEMLAEEGYEVVGEAGDGLRVLVVDHGGVAVVHQPADDIAAHPPEADHAELHSLAFLVEGIGDGGGPDERHVALGRQRTAAFQRHHGGKRLRLRAGVLQHRFGEGVRQAKGDEVRAATGFAIGGVPPVGHEQPVRVLVEGQSEGAVDEGRGIEGIVETGEGYLNPVVELMGQASYA